MVRRRWRWRRPSSSADVGKGTNGVSTNGVTAFLLLFDRWAFGVLPLIYLHLPKSAKAYLFPPICQQHMIFAATPIVLTPFVRNQGRIVYYYMREKQKQKQNRAMTLNPKTLKPKRWIARLAAEPRTASCRAACSTPTRARASRAPGPTSTANSDKDNNNNNNNNDSYYSYSSV